MGNAAVVEPDQALLILIDAQPLFLDWMAGDREPTILRLEHLLKLVGHFAIPVLATFEHPVDRNGWLPDRWESVFPASGARYIKQHYDLTTESDIRSALLNQPRRQALVAGAETDVCVLQSVLGLRRLGFQVYLLVDCLFTSEPNPDPALRRMEYAGAIPLTYKSLHYELKRTVAASAPSDDWSAAEIAAGRGGDRFRAPEDLPAMETGRSVRMN